MTKTGAIFCVGHLRDYRKHLDSFLTHVVEPNALDVYLSVDRKSSVIDRQTHGMGPSDEHDEEVYLQDKLGSRLKLLHWANEDPALAEARHLSESLVRFRTSSESNVWFVDQFVRLSYLVRLVQRQYPEVFSGYDYMVRFRIDVHVENLIPFFQWAQQCDFQPGTVWVRPDYSHAVKELFVCDPATFVRVAYNFPYVYGSYIPDRIEGLTNYGVPEYQLGQFLREGRFQLFQLHLAFGYREDTARNLRWVYAAAQPNFLTTTDPVFMTRMPTSLQPDDLELVRNSPGVQFHPAAFQWQPELFLQDSPDSSPDTTDIELTLSDSSDYVMIVIVSVLTAVLLATNLLWWRHHILHNGKARSDTPQRGRLSTPWE